MASQDPRIGQCQHWKRPSCTESPGFHEKVGSWKDNLLKTQLEILKLLSILFQISGAEKIYLKGYAISLFKRENMTQGIRTEVVLESQVSLNTQTWKANFVCFQCLPSPYHCSPTPRSKVFVLSSLLQHHAQDSLPWKEPHLAPGAIL